MTAPQPCNFMLRDAKTEEGFSKLVRRHLVSYFNAHRDADPRDLYRIILTEVERALFEETLVFTAHNKNRAADILGIHRNTLRQKIEKLGLEKPAPKKR